MSTKTLSGREVVGMTNHWIETPMNGYLGSSYGQNIKSYLQQPQTDVVANNFIQKLRHDVPILEILPSNAVSLFAVPSGIDRSEVFLNVSGQNYNIGTTK